MKCTASTGYLTFDSESTFKEFQAKYNNHIFLDERGNNYKMSIEQAMWQKVPKRQSIPETSGTYESTEDYKKFVEYIGKEVEMAVRVDQLEEEKEGHKVASLVSELNEFLGRKISNKGRKTRKPPKEDVKYVLKKRPKQDAEGYQEEIPEHKPKSFHKGKGTAVIYRRKQPKDDTK